ncbi:lipocalin-15-like isoform X2 [Colius striatus]|uniref:lipocalin-15-like isoform X2 n=1 Tax=Colius striatus TaxID=57412 RepID=UPI002B1DC17F|nr:lipocalin-15-like isoform X2 [Colius striatus]
MPWVGGGCPGWVADALGGWWVPRVDARCPWHSQPPLQFAGTWHVAAAASNCSVFLRMKDGMKSPISTISITPGGDMAMTLILPLLDRCQKFELLLQQRGQPGHYMVQEKRELHVLETDYGHYGIVQQLQHSGQGHSVGLQLLTRGQHVSPQLLQRFQELLPTVGLTKDMLAVLPKSGECQEGAEWAHWPAAWGWDTAHGIAHDVLTPLLSNRPVQQGQQLKGLRAGPPTWRKAGSALTPDGPFPPLHPHALLELLPHTRIPPPSPK